MREIKKEIVPRVSVVVGAYNCGEFIQEAITSVINQTFRDWELIVVDDGSSDDTCEKIKSINDKRIRLIELGKNSGLPAVPRNVGIRAARGEFIAFLDGDDIWLPEKLEKQLSVIEKDKDIFLVYAKCLVQQDGKLIYISPDKPKSGYVFNDLFLAYNIFPCMTVMIRNRRKPIPYFFDESAELKAVEDYDLWLRIAYEEKVAFVDEPLAIYRLHTKNISKGVFPFFRRIHIIIKKYSSLVPKHVLIRKYISFYANLTKNYLKYILDYFKTILRSNT